MEKCYVTDVTDLMDGRYGCDGRTDGPMDRETCQLKYYFNKSVYYGNEWVVNFLYYMLTSYFSTTQRLFVNQNFQENIDKILKGRQNVKTKGYIRAIA